MTISEREGADKSYPDVYIQAKERSFFTKRIPADILFIAVGILIALASFGIGILYAREQGAGEGEDGLWIENSVSGTSESPLKTNATESKETKAEPIPKQGASVGSVVSDAPSGGGQVVASKSGTKYYLPWCGTVSRIKEENKVWFASIEEAEKAGYEPAKNCKGL